MKKFLVLLLMIVGASTMSMAQEMRNGSNAYVGKIERDGTIRDRSNAYVGKIESDGSVRNRSNAYVGKVERDGTVRDKSNRSIGKADGIERRYAALYFFFSMP